MSMTWSLKIIDGPDHWSRRDNRSCPAFVRFPFHFSTHVLVACQAANPANKRAMQRTTLKTKRMRKLKMAGTVQM